ncbi:MAG: hypothetical protein IJ371_06295 [Clostridia bacterium]|nr:hypothetical protein [Clostridia bacterium]
MKVITKMTGLRLLEEIANNNLSCGTMIRYKREDLMLMSNPPQPVYEYYKYTAGDKKFHRCDENGKLGAKGQERFINYSTLNKVFEIVEIIEEEQDIEHYDYCDNPDVMMPSVIANNFQRLNEDLDIIVKAVNELKKNER